MPTRYQIDGALRGRWGSFSRIGFPERVCDGTDRPGVRGRGSRFAGRRAPGRSSAPLGALDDDRGRVRVGNEEVRRPVRPERRRSLVRARSRRCRSAGPRPRPGRFPRSAPDARARERGRAGGAPEGGGRWRSRRSRRGCTRPRSGACVPLTRATRSRARRAISRARMARSARCVRAPNSSDKAPFRRVPQQVHLPQAVAGVQVAQRGEGVGVAARDDVRHGERVPQDGDRIAQTGHGFPAAAAAGAAAPTQIRNPAAAQPAQHEQPDDEPSREALHGTSMICSRCVPTLT